jgi:hypothetical protein
VSDDIDFFISFHSADAEWAEWIAWTLEKDGGYHVRFQLWDFPPGTNFILAMQDVTARAKHTIAVLSPAFLRAGFPAAEWAAALARDPQGLRRSLIPVMVADCELDGLLAPIVYIRLVGLGEAAAREVLLRGVAERPGGNQPGPRPTRPPAFPGRAQPSDSAARSGRPDFPGPAATPAPRARTPLAASPRPGQSHSREVAPIPWTASPGNPQVRWADVPPLSHVQPEITRLELHVFPLAAASRSVPPSPAVTHRELVAAGRQGVFGAEVAVSVRTANDGVQAVLTGSEMTGLRAGHDGYLCAWCTLPSAASRAVVIEALRSLLTAVIALPCNASDVVVAAAARHADGTETTCSPGSISFRYLSGHIRQVADELTARLGQAVDSR